MRFSLLILFAILHYVACLKATPKLEFDDDFPSAQTSEEFAVGSNSNPRFQQDAVVIKKRSDPPSLRCANNKCSIIDNQRSITTDVHVKILTDLRRGSDEKMDDDEDDDVPVIKGYAGLSPDELKEMAPKVPSINLEPPRYEPRNWYEYFGVKSTTKTTTTKRPTTYYHQDRRGDDFHPYTIGDWDHVNRIPTGWKPIIPRPEDHYHFNTNGREDGLGFRPQFVTYCRCERKPLPRPPYYDSWLYDRTTMAPILDGKLMPPFEGSKDDKDKKKPKC